MAPVLPSALISTFTRPFPGHLSSGLGTLDASSSPADIAQALVDRCEAALRTMQENMPKGAGGSGAWLIRRCEAHVWSEGGRRGMRGLGRDEAVLLFGMSLFASTIIVVHSSCGCRACHAHPTAQAHRDVDRAD